MKQRIIKFRAWDFIHKRMRYVVNLNWEFIEKETMKTLIAKHPDDFSSYMQFTGLLDKNGKEIYEGDIVKNYSDMDEEYHIGKVEFIADKFTCEFVVVGGGERAFYDEMGIRFSWNELEIIGNIYENSGLLKVDKDKE